MQFINGALEKLKFDEGTYTNVAHASNSMSYPLHWHSPAEIILNISGKYNVNIGSNEYCLKPNDILFIPPGELHTMPVSSDGYHMVVQYDFSLISRLNDFQNTLPLLRNIRLVNQENFSNINKKLVNILLNINKEYADDKNFSNAYIYSLLLQIYVTIAREIHDSSYTFPNVAPSKHQEYLVKFTQLFQYIDKNITKNLTLDSLAEIVGFSKYHFSRLFKQYTGMTLKEYLNQQRITKAETLLLNPNLNVTEVALQSGFNSLSTFNRVFKDNKGCSPTEFQNLHDSH